MKGDFCPACGEVVLDANESQRVSEVMLEFDKHVNAFIVSPEFIISVCKRLNLDYTDLLVPSEILILWTHTL